jgi:hypothetical protein
MRIFVVTCHDSNDGQHDAGIGQGLPGYCPRIVALLMEGGVHQVGALHNNNNNVEGAENVILQSVLWIQTLIWIGFTFTLNQWIHFDRYEQCSYRIYSSIFKQVKTFKHFDSVQLL